MVISGLGIAFLLYVLWRNVSDRDLPVRPLSGRSSGCGCSWAWGSCSWCRASRSGSAPASRRCRAAPPSPRLRRCPPPAAAPSRSPRRRAPRPPRRRGRCSRSRETALAEPAASATGKRHPRRVEPVGELDGHRQTRQRRLEQVVAGHRRIAAPRPGRPPPPAPRRPRVPGPGERLGVDLEHVAVERPARDPWVAVLHPDAGQPGGQAFELFAECGAPLLLVREPPQAVQAARRPARPAGVRAERVLLLGGILRRARSRSSSAPAGRAVRRWVSSVPPSPAVRLFEDWWLNEPKSPIVRHPGRATAARGRARRPPRPPARGGPATSMTRSMSAIWWPRCTGRIARVRGVIAASTWSGSIVHLSASTSTNTGSAPAATAAYGVAANVSAGTITSSPQPMPSALSATSMVTVPLAITTPCRRPGRRRSPPRTRGPRSRLGEPSTGRSARPRRRLRRRDSSC